MLYKKYPSNYHLLSCLHQSYVVRRLVTQVEMQATVLRTPILLFIRLCRSTSIVLSFVGANLFLWEIGYCACLESTIVYTLLYKGIVSV